MNLTPQEEKVCYILAHPGCTSHNITRDTFIQKPCARIVGLESKDVVVKRVGQTKYPGSRPFKCFAIEGQFTKQVTRVVERGGKLYKVLETVLV